MKKLITLTAFSLLCAPQIRAQWEVYDPALHTQTILNGVQEVAKFVEVIDKQVQQIQTLTDQLNEFKHYESPDLHLENTHYSFLKVSRP